MWKDLSEEMKTVFEEAWTAFKNGNIPIGAAVYSEDGTLIAADHNRTSEPGLVNSKIAHAEMNVIGRIDTAVFDVKTAVLFTTMEPCPMCMGTSVMSNIKHLRYAARDPYCGAIHMKDEDPYLRGQDLDYVLIGDEPEYVQLVMQSYHELRCIERGSSDQVLKRFSSLNRKAVDKARSLYAVRKLDAYAESNTDIETVYDEIVCSL